MAYPLLFRIRSEFLEMPGLRLTVSQAERLCGAEGPSCAEVLEQLVTERFLYRRHDGSYARLTGGPQLRPAYS